MEAESYLSDGYAVRLQIQQQSTGWKPLRDVALVTQPSRLKGTLVSAEHGTPFLAATQIFDLRPRPRKWLSVDQIADVQSFFVDPSTILVTRSGTVGRATIAQEILRDVIVSDDLLRVKEKEISDRGWLFAYLRSPSIIRLMQSAHYGHIIKHLEISHLNDVPVVDTNAERKGYFNEQFAKIFENRNQADLLVREAESLLSDVIDEVSDQVEPQFHHTIRASHIFAGRRRFEGAYHASSVTKLLEKLKCNAARIDRLGDVTEKVWWMTRFSRNFGDQGTPYMSADELFSVGHVGTKKISTDPIPNSRDFFVKEGWLLMACSGQIYGLNGSVTLATKHDENYFFSHDLIRIAPKPESIRSGYLFTYLGHPSIGQLLIKRVAYGSSIPHIDPSDVESLPVPRLTEELEHRIADLAERASALRSVAAALERQVGYEADEIVTSLIESRL